MPKLNGLYFKQQTTDYLWGEGKGGKRREMSHMGSCWNPVQQIRPLAHTWILENLSQDLVSHNPTVHSTVLLINQ